LRIAAEGRLGLYWRWKSRREKPDRPKVERAVRDLIRRMSRETPLWGAAPYRPGPCASRVLVFIIFLKSRVHFVAGFEPTDRCRSPLAQDE